MADCERHLKACAACAKHYADLRRDLDGVKPLVAPARGEDYGEQVWQSIRGSLPVYEKPERSWIRLWRPLGWAAACAAADCRGLCCRAPVGAEADAVGCRGCRPSSTAASGDCRSRRPPRPLRAFAGRAQSCRQRRCLELCLCASEARELLANNRLVRQSAIRAGDLNVEASLDRLERLLVELANQPDEPSEADLNRLRQEMNTDGLLFDIRVLRSRVDSRALEPQDAPKATKGVSI